jgi:hypothetical protein
MVLFVVAPRLGRTCVVDWVQPVVQREQDTFFPDPPDTLQYTIHPIDNTHTHKRIVVYTLYKPVVTLERCPWTGLRSPVAALSSWTGGTASSSAPRPSGPSSSISTLALASILSTLMTVIHPYGSLQTGFTPHRFDRKGISCKETRQMHAPEINFNLVGSPKCGKLHTD